MGRSLWVGLLVVATVAAGAQEVTLRNPGFEESRPAAGALPGDQGFGPWTAGEGEVIPVGWELNGAYPGEVTWVRGDAHGGEAYARLRGTGHTDRPTHLFQPCRGLQVGDYYRISLWARGGAISVCLYEYRTGGISVPTIISTTPGAQWTRLNALYVPAGGDLQSVSLALVTDPGSMVEVDDVSVERLSSDVPEGLEPVSWQTAGLRLTLGPDGRPREFVDLATGTNYADPRAPSVFRARCKGQELPAHYVRMVDGRLEVHFADAGVMAWLRVEERPESLVWTLEEVQGEGVEWVGLCDLRLSLSGSVGTLVNAAWDDRFAACVLACNDRTHSFGAEEGRAALNARCYTEYGLAGARCAIVGVALDPPGTTYKLMDSIEQVELAQGLPHLTLNGVWIKRAPERTASYLLAAGTGEANIDQVVEFARGGFGCVELLNWWRSTPTYEPDPGLFPGGLAGLKRCADKIHAAGMQVGMHAMQGMVGWGGVGMGDPHVSPVADPRLLQAERGTLGQALDAAATEVVLGQDASAWPEQGDLLVEGEIIRYGARAGSSFSGCTRGLYGTRAAAHPQGAAVGRLVNCFNMWGNCIYAPDVNTSFLDEVCDNLARAFNAAGADMSYFDGGEEVIVQPPLWHNQGRIALGVQQRVDKPLILSGNALYTHLSWHVITRGSPSFDPIYFGRRDYTLRSKGQNPANWARNLLTGDVGWFTAHAWAPSTDAVTPDEVMLLCLKAVGGKSPISFIVDAGNLWANRRMPEMLEIIRACDEIKRTGQFSDEVCRELARPMAEHVLDRAADGRWQVRPLQFGPPRVVNAAEGTAQWTAPNPHAAQRPWVRIRGRARLAPYGDARNRVLADFGPETALKPAGAASADLALSVTDSAEKAPDGAAACQLRANNGSSGLSSWTKASLTLPGALDLTTHRPLGLWVYSEGHGGILNVQLVQGYGFRDHYVDLNYTGWRYHVLDPAETTRFYDYGWPYGFVDVCYWPFQYGSVTGVNLYLNALPAGQETTCLVSRVEALAELEGTVRHPALECGGQRLSFPVELAPEEYLELDWDGTVRRFERNGGLLDELRAEGDLALATGDNPVRFTCEMSEGHSARAEVNLCLRGEPLANSAPAPVTSAAMTGATGLHLAAGSGGRMRLLRGAYELAGGPPAHIVAAFDGQSDRWGFETKLPDSRRAAVVLTRPPSAALADYDAPGALEIENFTDLTAWRPSERNDIDRFVIGGEKVAGPWGPVRQGVSQNLATGAGGRVSDHCLALSATNEGAAGGWSGAGRRLATPLDLSGYQAVAFWLHGDGQRASLRFQFRDAAGAPADWVIPLDFRGWRLQVLRLADVTGFDWSRTEYLLLYYNDLPGGVTVETAVDGVRAIPRLLQDAPLEGLSVTLNGATVSREAPLRPGESWFVDGEAAGLVMVPGENQVSVQCAGEAPGATELTVRLVPVGPVP